MPKVTSSELEVGGTSQALPAKLKLIEFFPDLDVTVALPLLLTSQDPPLPFGRGLVVLIRTQPLSVPAPTPGRFIGPVNDKGLHVLSQVRPGQLEVEDQVTRPTEETFTRFAGLVLLTCEETFGVGAPVPSIIPAAAKPAPSGNPSNASKIHDFLNMLSLPPPLFG